MQLRKDSNVPMRLGGTFSLLVAAFLVLAAAAGAFAQDEGDNGLGFTFEVDFASKYINHGEDVYDDEAAFFPALSFDLFGTGFSISVGGAFSFTDTGELNDSDEVNYSISYEHSFFEEKRYQADSSLLWGVMTCPNVPQEESNVSEWELGVEFPELIPLGASNLVPSYCICWDMTMGGGPDDSIVWQAVGLSYELPIPAFIPGNDEQALGMSVTAEHWSTNDEEIDDGWAHVTFAFEVPFVVGPAEVTPYIAYQISTEDTVNDENELYGGIAMSVSF